MRKDMKHRLSYIAFALLCAAIPACSFLDPLPDGTYTDDNYKDYPKIIQGYVYHAYALLPITYLSGEFIGMDVMADNAIYTARTNAYELHASGNPKRANNPFTSIWNRDYEAIFYVNLFLKDNLGINTRYLLDPDDNARYQRYLQGDSYGLRAWYMFDLLKVFGGKTADGKLMGVPVFTEPVDLSKYENGDIVRASYDDCMKQILADCDSALVYLPESNKDFVVTPTPAMIDGAARFRALDRVAIRALKAKVYLTWASPAFNPTGDMSRWENAAKYAKEVMDYKLTVEAAQPNGFNPLASFSFSSHNHAEKVWASTWGNKGVFETNFYPLGFGGSASVTPTQNLVDAFGMANGYPITDSRSGYDPKNPYSGRDPRFYSTVNYHGAKVLYGGNASDVRYTFDVSEGGADAPGRPGTSLTGYYMKRFIYNLWDSNDKEVLVIGASVFFLRWAHMCLTFAEAANHVAGPVDKAKFGMSAQEALAYIRNRTTEGGMAGVGVKGDPYLAECAAAGEEKFDELVKNEWRIETVCEGFRYYDLRRWGCDLNMDIQGVKVKNGEYSYETIETRQFSTPWAPFPYLDVRKCPNLVQNAGWESWK